MKGLLSILENAIAVDPGGSAAETELTKQARYRRALPESAMRCTSCRFLGQNGYCHPLDITTVVGDVCDLWSGEDDAKVPELSDEDMHLLVKGITRAGKLSLTPIGWVTSNIGLHLVLEDKNLPFPHRFAFLVEDLLELLVSDIGWSEKEIRETIEIGRRSS